MEDCGVPQYMILSLFDLYFTLELSKINNYAKYGNIHFGRELNKQVSVYHFCSVRPVMEDRTKLQNQKIPPQSMNWGIYSQEQQDKTTPVFQTQALQHM